MKKIYALISVLLSVVLLSSCGSKNPNIELEDDSGSGEVTELTLWTFPVGNWGNPTSVASMLTDFHKAHPDIHVSVEYLSYDNGDEKINQAAVDGSLPDLVLEGPERLVANWGEKGWMVDLSELWESDTAGAIYDNIREACQHGNGAYYVFPICMSAHCMAINYDMFQEAGALQYIDEDTHTWTTEDFIEAVWALNAYAEAQEQNISAGIVYCKNQSGDQGTRALVNNLYGGTFADTTHTSYTVDSEENKKALQLLYDLEGIIFESSFSSGDAIDLFCKKETAMCFCWNASLEVQQTINNPNLDFEVFPMAFPSDEGIPELQGGIWGLGIFDNDDEERITAAKTFIRYMTENDVPYTRAVRATSYWPVRDMGNIYENDMLMTEYSIFMSYMGDYYQITPEWDKARTAWWQLLAKIGAGTDVSEAVKDFPSQEYHEDTAFASPINEELVIEIDGNKIYPVSTEMKDEWEAGDWVFFRYMMEEADANYEAVYPVLFRYRKGEHIAERVNQSACYSFDIVGDYLYYLDSVIAFQDHGVLYVSKLDGTDERILEEELHDFQIVDGQYIYYTYRHDTIGVGLEGHALHRMNLDGSDKMIVAYEVSGIDMGVSHFDYKVDDGWVDCDTFKMKVGEPADGYEEIVFKDIGDNDWVYYVTNRLMKARKDGSERVELDGVDDYYYEIERIEDDWIYYIKGGEKFKIRTDGSGKEAVA